MVSAVLSLRRCVSLISGKMVDSQLELIFRSYTSSPQRCAAGVPQPLLWSRVAPRGQTGRQLVSRLVSLADGPYSRGIFVALPPS